MIYIVVFMSSIFFAWLAERSKNKGIIILCSVISILIPSILGGLRAYGIGTDTRYYGLLDALQALSSPNLEYFMSNNRQEPGYKLIVYFTMKTFGDVNWCYFFYQIITISCFYIGAYRHKKKFSMPLILLMFYLIWYHYSYNAMRQCISASIIFMGLDTLENKQYFKFTLYVLVATLFHYSSVIAIILLLFVHIIVTSDFVKENSYLQVGILYGAIFLMLIARPLMTVIASLIPFLAKYVHVLDGSRDIAKVSNSQLGIVFGEILMLIFYGKGARRMFLKSLSKNNFEFFRINVVIIACITYSITIQYLTQRFVLYSHYANIILLSSMPKFVKEKHLKLLVGIAVIAGAAFYWWYVYIYRNACETWPYKSILD